jgi:hypothetical protein
MTMKSLDSKSVTIVALAVAAIALAQVYFSNGSSERSAHKLAVENAIRDFPTPYDSSRHGGDSISFYLRDSLVGTAVVEVE